MDLVGKPRISVTDLAKIPEEREMQAMFEKARERKLYRADLLHLLDGAARAKARWIKDFSTGRNKRPDAQIQNAELQLTAFLKAIDLIKTVKINGTTPEQ